MTEIEHELLNPIGVSPKKWRFADTVVQCQHKFQNNSDKPPHRGFPVIMILQTMNINESRMVPIDNSSYAKNGLLSIRAWNFEWFGSNLSDVPWASSRVQNCFTAKFGAVIGWTKTLCKRKVYHKWTKHEEKKTNHSFRSLSLFLSIGLSKSSAQKCGIYLRICCFLEMWIGCQPVGKRHLLLHDPTMTQTPGHRWSHRLWSVNFYYRKWPST